MPSKPAVPSAVLELFAVLPAHVRMLALSARDALLASVPDALEIPDAKAKVIGYGYGSGYKDIVATLMLSKSGVKIGLLEGASLPDPASLLQGAGKVHRHIVVHSAAQLQRREVRQLLETGLRAWRKRSQRAEVRKTRNTDDIA